MPEEKPVDGHAVSGLNVRDLVRQAVEEFVRAEQQRTEPAYKAEVQEERKRREGLEARLNQVVEENRKAHAAVEEADRNSQIRGELQRLGVAKVDLAFRAVKDDIVRGDDGRLQAKGFTDKSLQDYLGDFVQENPELLPARIAGGSGIQPATRSAVRGSLSAIDIEGIRPGMDKEDLDRVRQEIARLMEHALRGA
jgi:hypothetical protein